MEAGTKTPVNVLIIDNYDSFTFNLVQYLGELGALVDVVRNDVKTVDELLESAPTGVVISPGPGEPKAAGVSIEMVSACAKRGIPLLGVCLGHQAIGVAFGGQIVRARSIMHGKVSSIQHDGSGVLRGIESPFTATRYHSLVVERESCPEELVITARSDDGEIMALRHREFPVEGVQFHPESILTRVGKKLLGNFLVDCSSGGAA